jgi:hypothetical protein
MKERNKVDRLQIRRIPEDGGGIFLRNAGMGITEYTAQNPKKTA